MKYYEIFDNFVDLQKTGTGFENYDSLLLKPVLKNSNTGTLSILHHLNCLAMIPEKS